MSRIDDALRRTREAADQNRPDQDRNRMFEPAWEVAGARSPQGEASGRPGSGVHRPLHFSAAWRDRLARGPAGNAALIEQFRRLAATMHHLQQSNGIRTLMVTSATPGDGKTLSAINLAIVLAESYRSRVLLVDADLRRPSIPSVVELGGGTGLSEALRAAQDQKLALVPLNANLTLLPAGQPIVNSIEALTSPRMRVILDEAVARYDWVILDAPPVGPAADARLLAQMVDGVLFVVRAGKTPFQVVRKSIETLGRDRILGVVLNGVDAEPMDGYYYTARRGGQT